MKTTNLVNIITVSTLIFSISTAIRYAYPEFLFSQANALYGLVLLIFIFVPYILIFPAIFFLYKSTMSTREFLTAIVTSFLYVLCLSTFTELLLFGGRESIVNNLYILYIAVPSFLGSVIIWLMITGWTKIIKSAKTSTNKNRAKLIIYALSIGLIFTFYTGSIMNEVTQQDTATGNHWYIHRGLPFSWVGNAQSTSNPPFYIVKTTVQLVYTDNYVKSFDIFYGLLSLLLYTVIALPLGQLLLDRINNKLLFSILIIVLILLLNNAFNIMKLSD